MFEARHEKTQQNNHDRSASVEDTNSTVEPYISNPYTESESGSSFSGEYEEDLVEKNPFKRFYNSFKPYDYTNLPVEYFTHNEEILINAQSQSPQSPLLQAAISSPTGRQPAELHPSHPHFDYSRLTELERAAIVTSTSPLSKSLKSRHLQMIAIGGAIGTGLFISSGESLASAGPLGLLLVWLFMSSVIYVTMSSLAELSVAFPVSGAFITFNTLFIDQSWGFAMAWNYALQWLVTMPLELIAASITIQYWNTSVNPTVFVAVFYVVICGINLFGVKGYGEAEYIFSIMKVCAVIGFIILSIIIVSGGAPPEHRYIGGTYWHKPEGGLFNEHSPFKNICSILFSAAFAYSGVELFALASCETVNPKKSIPKAIKQVFWRILLFYILSIIMISLLVSYKDERLLGSGVSGTEGQNNVGVNINTSPFVLAIEDAKIKALPSIMNVVIIITVLSVGNASVYGSSRTLAALGALKQGPQILNYIDRSGRPIVALLVQFVFGLLCFLVGIPGQAKTIEVFDWLLALSGCCSIFTWWSICLCHLRFRRALSKRAREAKDELVYTSNIFNSWYGLVMLILVLAAQFWAALFPTGNGGKADVSNFFQTWLGACVVFVSYVGHKLYVFTFHGVPLNKLWLTADEIDVDTGRRDIDLELVKQELAEDREKQLQRHWIFRIYRIFC
ncbi:general amino-acid permease Gap1p [[Candida] railenensis]|uniref:General amino-acid permease Gap1p n=1 Tax=[Candida] railenensis TaxID=45579 RepID=A0A9P0VWA0_9ASCO|nr:general amino-acid permease Gap1p [[Candida] railenensis]